MTDDPSVKISDLPKIVNQGLCIGCGFCTIPLDAKNDNAKVQMKWSNQQEIWVPVISNNVKDQNKKRICPGKIMNMTALSNEIYGSQPKDSMVGHYQNISVGYSTDEDIRTRAASGGVTTSILMYLFSSNKIDVAYTAAGLSPYNGKGILAENIQDLKNCAGSHYHPVNFGAALTKLADSKKRFALVGLPCEVSAMHEVMRYRPDIKKRCQLMVGLFCGGINRFSGISSYLENFIAKGEKVSKINYRDGIWPGQIKLTMKEKNKSIFIQRIRKNSRINILRYMISFQGYSMLPRCRMCPDQIADFADIAVGDPHLKRFKINENNGYSAIVARTTRGSDLLKETVKQGMIAIEELTRDELVMSQGHTLENRRFTEVTIKIAELLGMNAPQIGLYDANKGSLNWHQYVYAFVDLGKIRIRKWKWLRPFYLPIQIFEYIFLTFSIRVILAKLKKILKNT